MMEVTWKSPSNIALIKYWGKYGNQLPRNPSLSLTLEEAYTRTTVTLEKKRSRKPSCSLLLDGQPQPAFEVKILAYLSLIASEVPLIRTHHLHIQTHNSFPHSSGIASSASAMSALAMCLCSLHLMHGGKAPEHIYSWASHLARLGSGSAARSIFPGWSLWGKTGNIPESSNKFAIGYPTNYHMNFNDIQDTILLVSKQEKAVSSRAGHALMQHHPMARQRFKNARARLNQLLEVLENGDWNPFIEIVEAEALELHALMMTSRPSYILMRPETLAIIDKIRAFREKTQLTVCFTLDAGPNVHVLYPYFEKRKIRNFIQKELLPYCEDQVPIYDHMGRGPIQEIS
jgi:diphosphomevalonate decarboxylase